MGDPIPGLDITINPCTCSLCASAVKAGGKPIHGPKDAGFIKPDDQDKVIRKKPGRTGKQSIAKGSGDERPVGLLGQDPVSVLTGAKAPPAIPPDPDIDRPKKSPPKGKGINSPNLLTKAPPAIPPDPDIDRPKSVSGNTTGADWDYKSKPDGNASGEKIRVDTGRKRAIKVGAVLAVALVVSLGFYLYIEDQLNQPKYLSLETVAKNLWYPIKFDVHPDGRIFYNEFVNGSVRIIENGVLLERPFATVDAFVEGGATGMIGLALLTGDETYVYIFYTYSRQSGEAACDATSRICEEGIIVANRVSRFKDMGNVAGPEEVIIEDLPAGQWKPKAWDHFGGILKFGPDEKLYVSVGDATNQLAAQDMSRLNGKILRLNPDGSIPDDNPFPGSPVYLLGVRNVFGMDFVGNTLYFTDNGPVGHDEMNIGVAGGNFGWPYYAGNVSWAEYEAGHAPTQEAIPKGNYIGPIIDFTPSIAPTGMAFYTGDKLGGRPLQNVVFFGMWVTPELRTLRLTDGEWSNQNELRVGSPILEIVDGPDGYLYISYMDRISKVVWDDEPFDFLKNREG